MNDLGLSLEPAWPWSIPTVGPIAMLLVALAMIALTVWTYLGVKKATWPRILLVLGLRLAALALTFCMLLRPSFAMTQLEGMEMTKLLVLFDWSESMNVADVEGQATRWQQAEKLWASPEVQRRLDRLAAQEKIEVVRYLAAEDLRAYQADALPAGKRSEMGLWLHQLWQKHGHERRLRGILLFSDGADNGKKFPATDKARQWRSAAPIHAFGFGDPNNPKLKKDIGLTSLRVADDKPIAVKSKFKIKAVAQAPGFEKTEVEVGATMLEVGSKEKDTHKAAALPAFRIVQQKDQWIELEGAAPELPGEYKLTFKVTPHPDEANTENNEISTFVQVVKEKLNVLWVDRPRVYEPRDAIRALSSEERFAVHYFTPPAKPKIGPKQFYEFDQRPYDLIIVGDISASQFFLGEATFAAEVKEMVTKKKTGLLMLGGSETFAKGGWQTHADWLGLLPVKLNPKNADFADVSVQAALKSPRDAESYPFLQLVPGDKANEKIWKEEFEPLEGFARVGDPVEGSTTLLVGDGEPILVVTQAGKGRTAVFAADSTAKAWRTTPIAFEGYQRFWKQLVLWLAWKQDDQNQLWITLEQRRVNRDASESLSLRFGLRDKSGRDLPDAKFEPKVIGPKDEALPIRFFREGSHQRGVFDAAKEPGEYRLVVKGSTKELAAEGSARFLVVSEELEKLRPLAEHETLMRLADASGGRFHVANEQRLLQYLDELKGQVGGEARQKTVYFPDWKRLPSSDGVRDQIGGLLRSFAAVGFILFVILLGTEWLLRRRWGLV